ncbi:hypothetical protein ACFVP3_36380 [Streptomyces sp. NPDC057806]|uniref:hypothetical protein n=1 Tax=Streptomyces sp. NPDC057806 TaxID=3346255 RepID=UPI0036957456
MTNAACGRATGRRHRAALLPLAALLLSAVAAACSDPRARTDTAPPSSPTRAAAHPRDLVGAWESARPGSNTTLAYRFTEENKYKYIGLLTYSMGAEGTYELTHIVEGTYEASADSLTLKPRSATVTRKNPENPERDHTNKPVPLETQHYRWTVADGKLSLVHRDGAEFDFSWVSR